LGLRQGILPPAAVRKTNKSFPGTPAIVTVLDLIRFIPRDLSASVELNYVMTLWALGIGISVIRRDKGEQKTEATISEFS
jgi:hypothetical protein